VLKDRTLLYWLLTSWRTLYCSGVSNPSYRPKSFSTEPLQFGKSLNIGWKPVEPGTEELHLASRIQHQQCVAIHRAVTERYSYRRLKGYTSAIGKPYEQFRRIMRGDAVLHLRDLAEAKVHFGDSIDLNVPLLGVTR
jgi:hypothetical protein